jgi:SagB-type dehydrogenase family enzyme
MIMSQSARDFHRRTTYDRHRMSGHALDWAAQPDVFKTYTAADLLPLPRASTWPEHMASTLYSGAIEPDPGIQLNTDLLGAVLTLSHALTAKATHGGVDFYYRSVASAGALYPFELYLGVSNVQGLADGIYHHSVASQALAKLRHGDITDYLVRGVQIDNKSVPVVSFFLTAIFYRSSWKYRDRAYRYHLLDTGHLAENLVEALTVTRVPFRLYYDFDDVIINDLLCLDTDREVCLAVALCWGKSAAGSGPESSGATVEDPRSASRVSVREMDYPVIREAHELTSHVVARVVSPGYMYANLGLKLDEGTQVGSPERSPELIGYSDAVFQRRSSRNFVRNVLPSDWFKTLLDMVCCVANSHDRPLDEALAVGLLVGNVEGVEPGFYLLDRKRRSLLPVAYGFMMDEMASVCLNQEWLGNCALHFLCLSNLGHVEGVWGPRAYRYAMLSAGKLGQRIYVGATAMGIGCCGIGAFYDHEASRLLGLREECSLLYLVAAGPLKKRSTGSRS